MKRFALFVGPIYYPSGGWEDYYGAYDLLEEAFAKRSELVKDEDDPNGEYRWGMVVDLKIGKIILKDGTPDLDVYTNEPENA